MAGSGNKNGRRELNVGKGKSFQVNRNLSAGESYVLLHGKLIVKI